MGLSDNTLTLIGILVDKAVPERHPENFHVKDQGPVLDIVQVMLKALLQRRIATPTVHLGPASHASFDTMPQHIARDALTKFLNQDGPLRAWSHQAHLALEDIPELGQFIQTQPPQERAQRGAAWIVLLGPHHTGLALGIVTHSAKFHHTKDCAIKAHTLLRVEHRTTGSHFHETGDQPEHGEREEQRRHPDTQVKDTFHDTVPAVHRRAAQGDDRQALKLLDTATQNG